MVYIILDKICVIGDIHGDYDALISALKSAKLISDNGIIGEDTKYKIKFSKNSKEINRWKWIGRDTYLVILGDMVDRLRKQSEKFKNKHTLGEIKFEEEIIQRVLNNLRIQAKQVNGNIIKIIGNHEKLNFDHDFRYVTEYSLENDGGIEGRKYKYSPGGLMWNLLKGVEDNAPPDKLSVNLHCIV